MIQVKNMIQVMGICLVAFLILSFFFTVPASAQLGACDFLPCEQAPGAGEDSASVNTQVENIFQLVTGLIFTGFIAFGIFVIIKGALKIIAGEESEEKLQEGLGSIKGVVIGVIILVIGVIGLVIISAIFNAGGLFSTEVETPAGIDSLPVIN